MHLTLSGDSQRLLSLLMEIGIVILANAGTNDDPISEDVQNEVHIPLNTSDGATWLHLHFDPNLGDAVVMTLDDDITIDAQLENN